jgi:hypothetical protein
MEILVSTKDKLYIGIVPHNVYFGSQTSPLDFITQDEEYVVTWKK